MDSPMTWAFIWLALASTFGVGEILVAGSFFLLPFAVGALVAAIASFLGLPILGGWILFIVASMLAFFAMKPLAKKLDEDLPNPTGVGANRLIGGIATVADAIPGGANDTGLIRIGGEDWLAQGRDGMGLALGTEVRIIEVKGTRVVVEPANDTGRSALG